MKYVRLVVNTQPYYGSIRLVSEHSTWLEACRAGVEYRQLNPNANTLEIYDHTPGNHSHDIESYTWEQIVAEN